MKILIRNSDNVVVYAEPGLTLGADGTRGDGWFSLQFTSANAHLDDADLPPYWAGGVWSYTGGIWAVSDVTAHATMIAAERLATVPRTVTRRQARQALLLRGTLALVQPAIDAIHDATQRGLMQIEWDDSLSFDRDRPSLIAIGTAIGYDSDALDDIFIFANRL